MIKQYNITDYIKDDPELQKAVIEEFLNDIKRLQAENYELKESLKVFNKPDVKKVLTLYNCGEIERLEQELKAKDNFLKWLITQQYYIIPKNLKQKIKEILKDV